MRFERVTGWGTTVLDLVLQEACLSSSVPDDDSPCIRSVRSPLPTSFWSKIVGFARRAKGSPWLPQLRSSRSEAGVRAAKLW